MKRSGKFVIAVVMTLVCGAITFAAKNDYFHNINEWFNNELGGVNETWYEISKYAGYGAFVVVGAFALVGLVQLIKRKSLFKVDREIICMGFLYIVTLSMYYAFTKIAITMRPALAPGETTLEPSFPSSHTMLAIVVCASALLIINKYISNKGLRVLVQASLMVLMLVSLYSRISSGIHWLSDIVAGIIYAITLVLWYDAVISKENVSITGGKHYKK